MTRWATVVALGLAVVLLAGGDRETTLSPGPLTAQHAEVAGCVGCHEAGDAGPSAITRAAFDGLPDAHAGDSQACLTCHEVGERPFRPHGGARLGEVVAPSDAATPQLPPPYMMNLASQSFPEPDATSGGTACATCHTEHQGAHADIAGMSDARCQACHTRKFGGFTDGHPAFTEYPYNRRTGLDFDHVAHARTHFGEADATAPRTCRTCHARDGENGGMATRAFEASCAACHAGEIRGEGIAGSPGVPVLGVPGLDVLTLGERGVAIGQWPELADGDLTPFTRAILVGRDDVSADTLARFAALDTLDLRGASRDELQVVERVAWAFKRLVYDLTAQGPQAVVSALQSHLRRSLPDSAVRDMLGGLPQDTIRAAQRKWFPDLATELARRDAGEEVPIPGGQPADTADAAGGADDGDGLLDSDDGRDDSDLLGNGGNSGTGSEPDGLSTGDGSSADGDPLSDSGSRAESNGGGLLNGSDGGADNDTGGLTAGADDGGNSNSDREGDDLLGGDAEHDDGDLLGNGGNSGTGSETDGLSAGDGSSDDGGLLSDSGSSAASSGGGLLEGSDGGPDKDTGGLIAGADEGGNSDGDSDAGDAGAQRGAGGDLLGGGSDDGGGLISGDTGGDSRGTKAEREIKAEMPEAIPADWTALGGWYRDFYVLSYRPKDHGDPFIRSWLETTAPEAGSDPAMTAIFERLSDPKAPGRCAKCHSVDRRPDKGFRINWRAGSGSAPGDRLTRFRHGPHLTLTSGRDGCATCHKFDRDADYAASFDDRDPGSFASNFASIDRGTCAGCHTPDKAGSACIQCHNYHGTEPRSQAVTTRMRDDAMGR